MSRKQRAQSLREAKDKRMKMVAAGGAVLLAVVLAFEVPKVMHSGNNSSPTPPASTTATGTPATGSPATTAPGTAAAASLSTASTKLPTSDLQPRHGKAQLFSFSHFASKDPFVQQISAAPPTTSGTGGSGGSGGSSKSSGSSSTSAKSSAPTGSSRTLAVTGAARISVNGRVELVKVGASFPSASPLFKLVSVSRGIVQIGIANGSYSSGARTVRLGTGRTLTLVDTADGIRYRLRLISAA
jgi:hypothetical protein